MRRLFAFLALATALVVSACGTEVGPTAPPVVPPPAAVVVSISVQTETILVVGVTKPVTAIARKPDGTTEDVTTKVVWSSSVPAIATVSSGMVTAVAPGSAQISATLGSVFGALNVKVEEAKQDPVAVAYNQLSSTVKTMVGWFMASNRALWRMDIGTPVKLWADSRFPAQNVAAAIQHWKDRVGVTFVLVADSMQASVKMVYDSTVQNGYEGEICGDGGGMNVVNDVITAGRVRIRPDKPGCSDWYVLAHELGHVLGSMVHAPSATDVMSAPAVPVLNPDQTAAFRFVYNVAPLGWKIP